MRTERASLDDLLIDHSQAVKLERRHYTSQRRQFDRKRNYDTAENQHAAAIIHLGYETGGFPVGKSQLVKIFDTYAGDDFYTLRETMRDAIQLIEHNNMTMEQISSAAHICAVVAYKKAGQLNEESES